MEIANLWAQTAAVTTPIRVATRADAAAITDLLRHAPYSHIHVDWHYPVDWLGSPGFVVQEDPQTATPDPPLTSRLFSTRARLLACLAVAADPPPAAWVRLAALEEVLDPVGTLAAMLAEVVAYLRETAVTELAWMPIEDWPAAWLHELGFHTVNEIETYVKNAMTVPPVREVPGLVIRPVDAADLSTLAQIEAEAFVPLWRHSKVGLTLARRQAFSFDVAELNGQIVGFQFSTHGRSGAHLARMTVAPAFQGSGIGSALLAHTIRHYQRRGLRQVTLNTQVDNLPSQRLYKRFGFHTNGERFPVWGVVL